MRRFKNILLVMNGSDLNGPETQRALTLARINRARLTVVDVLQFSTFGLRLPSLNEKMLTLHRQLGDERKQELEKLFFELSQEIYIRCEVLLGKPFAEVIRFVQKCDCDLVIKAVEEEKRFSSILFGSTDLQLLRKCPCPVWVVKADDKAESKKILAAVQLEAIGEEEELDELNLQIVEIASSMAHRENGALHIVNAWIVFDGETLAKKFSKHYKKDVEEWVEEQRQNIAAAQLVFQRKVQKYFKTEGLSDISCTFHFLEGEAEEVIAGLVEGLGMDLVIMGTAARTDIAGFFVGNISEAVLRQIDISVLAVKPPGFISPVTAGGG
ncbi:MAG TPA: universal stress protein [Desulfopila sp.]|nr:universal stress protein [Desulfopila sp.]